MFNINSFESSNLYIYATFLSKLAYQLQLLLTRVPENWVEEGAEIMDSGSVSQSISVTVNLC